MTAGAGILRVSCAKCYPEWATLARSGPTRLAWFLGFSFHSIATNLTAFAAVLTETMRQEVRKVTGEVTALAGNLQQCSPLEITIPTDSLTLGRTNASPERAGTQRLAGRHNISIIISLENQNIITSQEPPFNDLYLNHLQVSIFTF